MASISEMACGKERKTEGEESGHMMVTVSLELSMNTALKWYCWITLITPLVRVHCSHCCCSGAFHSLSFLVLLMPVHTWAIVPALHRHCSSVVTVCPPRVPPRMLRSLATPSSPVKALKAMLFASTGSIDNHGAAFFYHHSLLKPHFVSRNVEFSVHRTDICCPCALRQQNERVIFC